MKSLGLHRALMLRIGGLTLQLSIAMVLSRMYGALVYGTYAYFFSWVQVLSIIATLGLDWYLVRETAYHRSSGNPAAIPFLIRTAHRYTLVSVTLGALILISLNSFLAPREMQGVLRWVALALPAATFLRLEQGALQGLGYPIASQFPFYVGLPSAFLCSLLGFAIFPFHSIQGILGLYLFWLWGTFAGTALWLLREARAYPRAPMKMSQGWLKSSIQLLTSNSLGILAHQLPVLFAGTWLGPIASGLADLLVRGSLLIALPLSAANLPLAPFLAGTTQISEQHQVQRTITHATRRAFFLALGMAIGYLLIGPRALFWMAPAYVASWIWFFTLALAQLVNVGVGPVVLILNMRGYEQESLKGLLLGLSMMVLCGVILRPWGLGGILSAYAFSVMIWNLYLTHRVYRLLGLFPAIWHP